MRFRRIPVWTIFFGLLALGTTSARDSASGAAGVSRVSVEVKAIGRAELDTLCPILEGRLLARKEEGGIRFVAASEPADYRLLIEVADMTYTYSEAFERGADAESDPNRPKRTTTIGSELSLDVTLSLAGSSESVYEDTLGFTARRPVEPPEDRIMGLLLDDLMSRVTEKLPKMLRKRLRS